MSVVLVIKDESARGEQTNSVRVTLTTETLSLRDLIGLRVQAEVESFNRRRPMHFKALVQPHDAQDTAQGLRLTQHRDLDAMIQTECAIKAFEQKRYFVMVNGKDIKDLDAVLSLDSGAEVIFIKLMAVVCG